MLINRSFPTRHATAVSLSLFLVLGGCAATYRQDGLNAQSTQMAIIEDEPCQGANCLVIQEIDGKFRGVGLFKRYELMPGKRTLKILYQAPGVTSQGALLVEFEAGAGYRYGIRANASSSAMRWAPEVYDRASGQTVSRIVGTTGAY